MSEWLIDDVLPIVGILLCLGIAWTLLRSLFRHEEKSPLHLLAFCTHCGWEGRVQKSRMVCLRCGSHRLSVVAT